MQPLWPVSDRAAQTGTVSPSAVLRKDRPERRERIPRTGSVEDRPERGSKNYSRANPGV